MNILKYSNNLVMLLFRGITYRSEQDEVLLFGSV